MFPDKLSRNNINLSMIHLLSLKVACMYQLECNKSTDKLSLGFEHYAHFKFWWNLILLTKGLNQIHVEKAVTTEVNL